MARARHRDRQLRMEKVSTLLRLLFLIAVSSPWQPVAAGWGFRSLQLGTGATGDHVKPHHDGQFPRIQRQHSLEATITLTATSQPYMDRRQAHTNPGLGLVTRSLPKFGQASISNRRLLQRSSATPVQTPPVENSIPSKGAHHPGPDP